MSAFFQSDFFRLRPEVRLAAWVALGLGVLVVMDQWHYWSSRDDFSFGYLVPFFIAYVVHDRWPQLKAILLGEPGASAVSTTRSGQFYDTAAIFVVAGSLLVFAIGGFLRAVAGPDTDPAFFLAAGLAGYVLAMGFLVSRQNAHGQFPPFAVRRQMPALLFFPAMACLLSAPILLIFETRIKAILLQYVVAIVAGVFDFLGFDIYPQGNVLILPHGSVGVEDACSGIRSLTACLFSGSFLAAVFLNRWWKKILLLVMSAILAFVMNIGRSLFLTGWAYANGDGALDADFWGHPHLVKAADGQFVENPAFRFFTVHDFAGYAVLGLTLAGLLLLLPLLNFKIRLGPKIPVRSGVPAETGPGAGPA